MNLNDALWAALLSKSSQNGSLRLRADNVPHALCEPLVSRAMSEGIDNGRLLIVYSQEPGVGSYPLPAGVKSAVMGVGALTRCRNATPGERLLIVVPVGAETEDSLSREVAAGVGDVLSSVEEMFFEPLRAHGVLFSQDRHAKLCEAAYEGDSEQMGHEGRWRVMETVSKLVGSGWAPETAYMASIGLPLSEDIATSENVMQKLAKFSEVTSPSAARQFFADAVLGDPELSERSDAINVALDQFFTWCEATGSRTTSEDWKKPRRLFRHKTGFDEASRQEMSWRTELDAATWSKLLAKYVLSLKVKVRVRDGFDPESPELEPFDDGSKIGSYLVKDSFALSLTAKVGKDHRLVPSGWKLEPASGEDTILSEADEHALETDDVMEESGELICTGFYGENKAKAKLVCLGGDELGYRLYVRGAVLNSAIIQPKTSKDKACVSLKEPGAFELVIAYDGGRFDLRSVSLGNRTISHENHEQAEGGRGCCVAIVRSLENDGSQQQLEFSLLDRASGTEHVQVVQITAATESNHGFRSWLHHQASCHALSRRLPRRFEAGVNAGMLQLLEVAWSGVGDHAAKPLVVPVDANLEGLEFVRHAGTGFAYLHDDTVSARTFEKVFRGFSIPAQVAAARGAFIDQVRASAGEGSILNVDLGSAKIRAACESYLAEFDAWLLADKVSAQEALEWMDTVHFHAVENSVGTMRCLVLLPSHPLVAMGLVGMASLLEPSGDEENEWRPPLSRLYCSSGPKSWVIRLQSGAIIYDLITSNEHYFRAYLARGSSSAAQSEVAAKLRKNGGLSVDCASLSLGSKDVVAVMDDICALNPALTEIAVEVASDRSGFVTEGLFRWFEGLDDECAPEHAGWGSVQPLNMSVSSSSTIIDEFDVEGRTAGVAGKTDHYLRWYEVSDRTRSRASYDFAIFGELGSTPSATKPSATSFPKAINLGRIGSSLSISYVAHPGQREYARSCGNDFVDKLELNRPGAPGTHVLAAVCDWNDTLATANIHISYGDVGIATSLQSAQFVALPISGSSDMQAVAGVDTNSAVWKFDNAEFDADRTTIAGHVILTGKLDLIRRRMSSVLMSAGLPVAHDDEVHKILLEMGRAGINTLHALADNELVLLGAVSSLAVMRSYEGLQVERLKDDGYPVLVLPLDSFGRVFEQLNPGGTRPDFLCFTFARDPQGLRIQVDIMEAKWRKDIPSYGELQRMLGEQVLPFKEKLAPYFTCEGSLQSRVSAATLLSELIAAAVRLREAVRPDDAACAGPRGALAITEITAALFSGKARVDFGKNAILTCVSKEAEKSFLNKDGGSTVATMSVNDAVSLLRDSGFLVAWEVGKDPAGEAGAGLGAPSTPAGSGGSVSSSEKLPSRAEPANDEAAKSSLQPGAAAPSHVIVYPEANNTEQDSMVADDNSDSDENWPPKPNEFGLIGQDNAVRELVNKMAMQALGRRFSDTMFIGPAGVGKSTFARQVAKRLNLQEIFLSGSDVKAPESLVGVLKEKGRLPITRGNVIVSACLVFIDEVHAIGPKASNFLLSALDDKRHATHEGKTYDFSNVVFLFATTDKGKLTQAFISRPHPIVLPSYTLEELAGIIASKTSMVAPGFMLSRLACREIAARNRCSPRRAVKALEYQVVPHFLMKRPDNLAKEDLGAYLTKAATRDAIAAFYESVGIDRNGLSLDEIKLLEYLKSNSPASRERIRNFMKISNENDYAEVSEYLDRLGLIETDSKGVSLTNAGHSYLAAGKNRPDLTSRI